MSRPTPSVGATCERSAALGSQRPLDCAGPPTKSGFRAGEGRRRPRAPRGANQGDSVSAHLDSPAWGLGLATVTAEGQVLDTWYPAERLGLGGPPPMDAPYGVPLSATSIFHLPLEAVTDR